MCNFCCNFARYFCAHMANEIKHTGTIIAIEGETVRVKIEQSSACSACQAKAMCTSTDKKEKIIEVAMRQTAALTEDRPAAPDRRQTPAVRFPQTFAELRALPGVGEYTAGAIASFAYNMPYPALDGNVYRVLARLYDCDTAFDTSAGKRLFRQLAEELLDRDHPRMFNTAIMEFGALHCLPVSPDCTNCPVQAYCRAFAAGTAELLPVRKPRNVCRRMTL